MAIAITYSLTENAIDFLKSAVSYVSLKKTDVGAYKYAILHLCDGIELLLKCRLHCAHWTLVLADIDRTSRAKFETGDFKSVSWEDAITRIEKVIGQDFGESERSLLERLRKLRNQMQHFEVKFDKEAAIALLAEGLHFATNFVEDHLQDKDRNANLEIELQDIRMSLTDFDEFVQRRMSSLKKKFDKIRKHSRTVLCPACRQDALHADDGKAACLFCGYTDKGRDVAMEWASEFLTSRLKDLMVDDRFGTCPECGENSCVDVEIAEGQGKSEYFCFSCGVTGRYEQCSICGGFFEPEEDEAACGACYGRFMEED